MKRIPFSLLLVWLSLLSACGSAPGTPTSNPVDVQNTAVVAAFTIIAQTRAAAPTATASPLPPATDTPVPTVAQVLPTETLMALPTVGVPTSAPATQAGVDPCSTRILSGAPKGRETTIQIINTVKAQVTVSVYLNETASWGECGYRSYILGPRDNIIITDLVQGCYDLWAFNSDPKKPVNGVGGGCINNSDKWIFEIFETTIKFTGP